ncbi:uncharacterized protein LOC111331817 isoform X2 [Stylophora pistillata]|uniref:uncharacterized protein LOC111331817 isoform X2 n=1 Tax=Stylophora pistillata TaxID=50429 RepID=UPI000C04AAAD|nr:uncharacterized protein LOC111331817 isoform X2 [Stylophora pistillata]
MDLARIKKKEGRYKKGVQFNKEMDEIAVRERLINDLPILKDKRFCCAARKSQGMAELDFVRNPRRVWDGKTIRRRLPGSSALFILIEEDEEDFSSFHDTEVEDFDLDTFVGDRLFEEQIGKNEKLRSSQVTKDLTDSSGQTDSGACSEGELY